MMTPAYELRCIGSKIRISKEKKKIVRRICFSHSTYMYVLNIHEKLRPGFMYMCRSAFK